MEELEKMRGGVDDDGDVPLDSLMEKCSTIQTMQFSEHWCHLEEKIRGDIHSDLCCLGFGSKNLPAVLRHQTLPDPRLGGVIQRPFLRMPQASLEMHLPLGDVRPVAAQLVQQLQQPRLHCQGALRQVGGQEGGPR